ncbi:UvrD-helicase domain-containing protein [Mycolicibacterium lutetiense]|uniref:DNA helicase n=1 Tax=Mycolicibacterium lutetiense TaxID=1641992 RepID=A0ABS4ZSA3_9MYCO|nr:UvrD-helicase domain-containing protein [Mycolicibacterium lutetiense]MBP2452390.1 hypothetical protein [Mycolicibacterium lutetiense]
MELAAGGGKTWLLVDTVRQVAGGSGKTLVLTHTHAGVHSIRNKMRTLGVASDAAHVGTITSLAFELVRSYSRIAGMDVPPIPDWADSNDYIEGARRVMRNPHVRDVFKVSYSHLLVDEYQDCSLAQHMLVTEFSHVISNCAVFGDPLQGIFGFRDPLVDWNTDVLPHFPAHSFDYFPRRWMEHNQPLGHWLYRMRDRLRPGASLTIDNDAPSGVTFIKGTPRRTELIQAALRPRPDGESVVIITPPDKTSARTIAAQLKGTYGTMEDVRGTFMIDALTELENAAPERRARWLADMAKSCFTGYANVNKTVLNKLATGQPVAGLTRPGLEQTLAAFDRVLTDPTFAVISDAMRDIRCAKEAQLHSREAWTDIAAALERCGTDPERSAVTELGRIRDRLRHSGRPATARVVSRTALIKGLEFDHVIVANLERQTDHCNLYVALSRARKTLTIIGKDNTITITETKRTPNTKGGRSTSDAPRNASH